MGTVGLEMTRFPKMETTLTSPQNIFRYSHYNVLHSESGVIWLERCWSPLSARLVHTCIDTTSCCTGERRSWNAHFTLPTASIAKLQRFLFPTLQSLTSSVSEMRSSPSDSPLNILAMNITRTFGSDLRTKQLNYSRWGLGHTFPNG